ncbi:MAG: hypothetical protein AAFU85_15955 [Planctomycetota bacterium]
MAPNPYKSPVSAETSRPHRIQWRGFAKGALEATLFSALLLSVLIPFARRYHTSFMLTTLSTWWIPVVWVLSAGTVAEIKYRKSRSRSMKRPSLDGPVEW